MTAGAENGGKRRRIPKFGSMSTATKDSGFGAGVFGQRKFLATKGVASKTLY